MNNIIFGFLIALLILLHHDAFCEEKTLEQQKTNAPKKWGVAMGIRSATIPFDANKSVLNDILPLIFYDNGRLFIDGLEFGYRLLQNQKWQLSPFARYRFFDIPEEYQNEIRESGLDLGGQLSYHFTDWFHTDFEVLSDQHGRFHANLTPGIVHHHSSEVQDRSTEYVLAVKFYYTIKWPTQCRLGFAEGLSYLDKIPYLEEKDMQEKGYRPSQLLNFLDFSLDVSLGHLFRVEWMEDLWLGYSIHHRSGIYSKSSAFGRISGGRNYNTVYLQYHW